MYVDGKVIVAETCPTNRADHNIDISSHNFKFVVAGASYVFSELRTDTEVFGYFQPEGLNDEDWTDDTVETNALTVPVGSPIADIAQEIAADANGDKAHLVGEELRRAVAACSCRFADECPALGRLSLLGAMEKANARRS